MKGLKLLRVVLAILVVTLTTFLFFEYPNLKSEHWGEPVLALQFVPTLLKLLKGFSFIAFGAVLFTLLALLFGRVYCSAICPLGILQDLFIRINKRIAKTKRKFAFGKSYKILRYTVLVLSVLGLVFSMNAFLILLDPYSNYGRIATHIFQPIYILINNLLAGVANTFDYYGIYHVEHKAFHLLGFFYALLVVVLLLVFTRIKGRIFCNTLCPVGGWLGLLSKHSIFKLKFDKSACISCGKCEKECKSLCIDVEHMHIDFERCVTCYNCISVCPTKAINYHKKTSSSKHVATNKARREGIKTMILAGAGLFALKPKVWAHEIGSNFVSEVPAKSEFPVSPPGSISLEHYKDVCTSCHLCVSACPSNVIQATFMEFGLDALFVPKLDYDVNYCQYECTICGDICPTGAIQKLSQEEKIQTQLGKVVFVEDNCVVSNNDEDCGACAEHCPTKAVRMIPYKDDLYIPEVNTDICIGCGACEHPCPVRPHKAIFVESNTVHALAQLPEDTGDEQKIEVEEEFPF